MRQEVVVLVAEDDPGHATLIRKNLERSGIANTIRSFKDGQEILDFLFCNGPGPHREHDTPYVLLLDIHMPKVDGVEVLRQVKEHSELRKIPVIVLTTTDDPREIERCHRLGCSVYITKPVQYDRFVEALRHLGLFLLIVEIPQINGVS